MHKGTIARRTFPSIPLFARNGFPRKFPLIGFILLAFSGIDALPVGAGESPRTVIAIPPSPVLADFSGDVSDFFPGQVDIVVFPSAKDPVEAGLHIWDRARWRWHFMEWHEWVNGEVGHGGARRVMVVMLKSGNAGAMVEAANGWADEVETVEGYGLHEVANALNGWLGFSSAQWQYLSKRYNLTLRDRNYERRRYGRFGPPEKQKKVRRVPSERRRMPERRSAVEKPPSRDVSETGAGVTSSARMLHPTEERKAQGEPDPEVAPPTQPIVNEHAGRITPDEDERAEEVATEPEDGNEKQPVAEKTRDDAFAPPPGLEEELDPPAETESPLRSLRPDTK